MIAPQLAPVRPHIASPLTGDPLLLEDYVSLRMERGLPFTLNVCGSLGAGRRTAIHHLAATRLPLRPLLHDGYGVVSSEHDSRFVIQAKHESQIGDRVYLLPWTNDDLIEFVLSLDRADAGDIIRRCIDLDVVHQAGGKPGVCRLVVDALKDDREYKTVSDCIRHQVRRMLRSDRQYIRAARFGLLYTYPYGIPEGVMSLLRQRCVQVALAAELAVTRLRPRKMQWYPSRKTIPFDLLSEVVELAKRDPEMVRSLPARVERHPSAFVISVLNAVDPNWRPVRIKKLTGAILRRASWRGIELEDVEASVVDLRRSDLSRASIRGTTCWKSQLDHCDFTDTLLQGSNFNRAKIRHARFRGGTIERCHFIKSTLYRSEFTEASLRGSSFESADLSEASFRKAQISAHCRFDEANVSETDFSESKCESCSFKRIDFRSANLDRSRFANCVLHRCDLEFAKIVDASFHGTSFEESHLTGSTMINVSLRLADFRRAGLADIDWEGVDLRGADLRGCAFHMGSSRSGLVGSPYPGHGSKTGFYTNDFDDICHRPPEEIRKANLCGADLRGAIVHDTDFYLVDLRGARYDDHQRDHFVRCDAILCDRHR